MKTTPIMLRFDAAKLKALEFYLPQNNTSVEDELKKRLDEIYVNEVPDAVKEFIRFQSGSKEQNDAPVESAEPAKPSRRQKASSPKSEAILTETTDQTQNM